MTRSEVLEFMTNNPTCFLATVDDGVPRVRGMMIHKADENGIILATFKAKDLHTQVMKNPRVELCFFNNLHQVRVSGELEELDDKDIMDEVCAARASILKSFLDNPELDEHYLAMTLYVLKNGTAIEWTPEKTFEPKTPVQL